MPVFVGIDVAKRDFEACLLRVGDGKSAVRMSALQTAQGFASLLRWAKLESGDEEIHFCMESTGGYEFALACFLADSEVWVSVENPRRIKNFALAMGMTNKTDRADARMIASYALKMSPRRWVLSDETSRCISRLTRHREHLMEDLNRVRNHMEHGDSVPALVRAQLSSHEKLLKEQVEQLDEEYSRLIESSASFKSQVEALLPLPGVGRLTALTVVCEMPDVGMFDNAESWAAQAGLYPRRRQSGQWTGQSFMSKAGNAHVRRILYMGATMSMRLQPEMKEFAQRLRERGKKPKQIRVACMRKLLLMCYGILRATFEGRTPFYKKAKKAEPAPQA